MLLLFLWGCGMEIWVAVISGGASLLCALTAAYFAYLTKKQEAIKAEQDAKSAELRRLEKEETEKRAADRREESLILMEMIDANSELTDCLTNIMLTGDSSICDAQAAKARLEEARKKRKEFLERIRVEHVG